MISAACGDAKDLNKISKSIADYTKIQFAGFDINEENIKKAKLKNPDGVFNQGNIENFSDCIEKITRELTKKFMPEVTVVIFSGILQRELVSGSWEAAYYLQQAFRSADVVLVASIMDNLITPSLAKSIGFNVAVQNLDLEIKTTAEKFQNVAYGLKKQTVAQRFSFLKKRNQKRSDAENKQIIDLSLSADPMSDLKLMLEKMPEILMQATCLDISWGCLSQEEVGQLITFIADKMPALNEIWMAMVEAW